MKVTLGTYKSSRKLLSGVLLAVLVATSFLVSPEPATSSTPITFSVTVKDRDSGAGIPGQAVDYCHSGTGEWQCSSWAINNSMPEVVTNASGIARITVSLPNGTGYVQLEAGGYVPGGPSYSKSWEGLNFVNGAASIEPVLSVKVTPYIAVTVNVKDNLNAPVSNEWVQVSKEMIYNGVSEFTMTEWEVTDDNGNALFYLDSSLWLRDATAEVPTKIYAAVGVEEWSNFDLTEKEVSVSNLTGTSSIVVTSLLYSLEGIVKAEVNGALVPFAHQDLCLFIAPYNTQKRTYIDFRTNAVGAYTIVNLTERNGLQIQPHACRTYDEFASYDYQSISPSDITVNPQGIATLPLNFTAKGIRVTADDGNGNPAAHVQLRLDLQETDPEIEDYRMAVTDKNGVAYFGNLQPGEDYQLSYRSEDMYWTTPMYQDMVKSDLIENGAELTTVALSLQRVSDFPETPVTISGKMLDSDGLPIINGTVNINSNFGFGNNVQFRTRTSSEVGKEGEFSISGLPHGAIWLEVSAKGYRSINKSFQTTEGTNSYDEGSFRLRPSVVGNLQYGGILRDTEGDPVPNTELVLNHPHESGKEPQIEKTDSEGRFLFKGLTAGHHWVYADTSWEKYEWSHWSFNLPVSNVRASLVIVERGVANPDAQAGISGRIFEYLDVDGPSSAVGIEGVCVNVYPTVGGTVSVGTTDSSGNWKVSGLIDGDEYYIESPRACNGSKAFVPYDFDNKYEQPRYEDSIVTATVSGGKTHEWALKEISRSGPGSISGRVRDGEDYSNLAGVTIDIQRARGGISNLPSAVTDERGEYSFQNLPAGEYYVNVTGTEIGDQAYFDSWMSVEVTTEPNRANILLYKMSSLDSGDSWEGVLAGEVLDENGDAHGNARVEVFTSNSSFFHQFATTDNEGRFEFSGLPQEFKLFYKITPWWKELAILIDEFIIGVTGRNDLEDPIQLDLGSSISGQVNNVPQGVEVRTIHAELLDPVSGTLVHSSEVDLKTGQYVIGQVPEGNYKVRFTQNSSGSGWSEFAVNSVSMKPVYWNNTEFGTSDFSLASTINVAKETPVTTKDVTFSNGSILQGSVSIATTNGPIPLSGPRSIWVDLYKKDSEGAWNYVTWSELSATSNYRFQFVGLAPGDYKIEFIDSRTGNNSLSRNFYGGGAIFDEAPVIVLGDGEISELNHSMSIAPPEKSAEAFDLDSLTAARLAELKDAISLASESAPGSELEVFVGTEFAGNFVAAFANSTPVVLGDWKQVDSRGFIKVTIPTTLATGSHRIGVLDSQGTVFGWAPITITAPAAVVAQPAAQPAATKAKPKASKSVVEEEPEVTEKESSVTEEAPLAAPTAAESSSGDWLLPLAGGFLMVVVAGTAWVMRAQRVGVRRK